MTQVASRRSGLVAGLFVVTLLAAGCGGTDAGGAPGTASSTPVSTSPAGPGEKKVAGAERPTEAAPSSLTVVGVDDVEVTLAGPIATKYASATAAQKDALGQPLTGDHNAGTRGQRRRVPAVPGRRGHREVRRPGDTGVHHHLGQDPGRVEHRA